ncbi:MAG: hypothetical protein NVS9B15_24080 [Acidobacteriaceae bacterium]
MPITYSGRQFEITASHKKQAEAAYVRIQTVLGHEADSFELSVLLFAEHRSVKAEVRAEFATHKLSSQASAADGTAALSEALDRLTNQAHKLRSKIVGEKRHARKEQEKIERERKVQVEAEQRPERVVGVGAAGMQPVPVVVHDFPARVRVTETHVVRAENVIAKKKMSLEEAVKEMEFRDKDIFVFRDPKGKQFVVYRTRDGRLGVVELS